jgi:hypothetical protein
MSNLTIQKQIEEINNILIKVSLKSRCDSIIIDYLDNPFYKLYLVPDGNLRIWNAKEVEKRQAQ